MIDNIESAMLRNHLVVMKAHKKFKDATRHAPKCDVERLTLTIGNMHSGQLREYWKADDTIRYLPTSKIEAQRLTINLVDSM